MQTLKNIIVFFLIIVMTSCLAGVLLELEFYPIFLILVYLGAIVVNTLFVILTFDIREEYRLRDTVEEWMYMFSVQMLLMIPSVVTFPAVITRIVNERQESAKIFRSLEGGYTSYSQVSSHSSTDADILAATMYSDFSEYFLTVGAVLTIALFVAISVARPGA